MQPRLYQSLIGKCSQEATGCQLNFLSTYSVVSLVVPKLEEEILIPLLMNFFKRGGMVARFQPPTKVVGAHF